MRFTNAGAEAATVEFRLTGFGYFIPDGNYQLDASACQDLVLQPGGTCTVSVTLRPEFVTDANDSLETAAYSTTHSSYAIATLPISGAITTPFLRPASHLSSS